MSVVVLGTGRRYSSLDAYSEEFSNASGFPRIMLRMSKDQINSSWDRHTTVVDGNLSLPFSDGWGWNILMGNHVFRGLKEKLKKSIVHYTTFGLPLLTNNPDDIVTVHDLFFLDPRDEAFGGFFNLSEHFLKRFLRFNKVIAPSEYIKGELESYGFQGEITVIYMPAPIEIQYLNNKEEARKMMGLPNDKKLVLSISSSLRRKNLPVVEKTMKILGDEYKLVRVGPPISNALNYRGLAPEKINMIYNACDVLLFPTLGEGYGKPVVESFASGLPVVTSDIQIMREIADDAAILVEPVPEKCAEAIRISIDSEYEYRKRGFEKTKTYSREKFISAVNKYYTAVSQATGI